MPTGYNDFFKKNTSTSYTHVNMTLATMQTNIDHHHRNIQKKKTLFDPLASVQVC